jgi:hypothetical protein
MYIDADGEIFVNTPQRKFEPGTGDTVISFGPAKMPSLKKTLSRKTGDTEE